MLRDTRKSQDKIKQVTQSLEEAEVCGSAFLDSTSDLILQG